MSPSVPGLGDPAPTPRAAARVSWASIVIMVAVIVPVAYFLFKPNSNDPIAKWYLTEMKIDLVHLRDAEDVVRGDSSRYTSDLGSRFVLNPTLNPPTIMAADSTWSATITSKRFPGATCGMAVGIPNPVDPHAEERQPACVLPVTGLPKGR